MNGSTVIGSPERRRCCPLERLVVDLEAPDLPTQPDELFTLLGRQPRALALVDFGLFHPGADVRLGQIEVPGHLADAAIAAPAQLDDLSLELRSERATRRGFFLSMVSILDILSGAVPLMLDVRQTGGSPGDDLQFRRQAKRICREGSGGTQEVLGNPF